MKASRIKKLKQLASELIITEISYGNEIDIFSTIFFTPVLLDADRSNKPILSKEDIALVFSSLNGIQQLSSALRHDICAMLHNLVRNEFSEENDFLCSSNAHRSSRSTFYSLIDSAKPTIEELMFLEVPDIINLICSCFSKHSKEFEQFSIYTSNHAVAVDRISALKKEHSRFSTFIQDCSVNPNCRGKDLETYLILPVQRLCKYPLFFSQMVDVAKELGLNAQMLRRLEMTYVAMKSVAEAVNLQSDSSSRLRIYNIGLNADFRHRKFLKNLKHLNVTDFSVFSQGRSFQGMVPCLVAIRHFYQQTHGPVKLKPVEVLFFSDMLLFCKRKGKNECQISARFLIKHDEIVNCTTLTKNEMVCLVLNVHTPRHSAKILRKSEEFLQERIGEHKSCDLTRRHSAVTSNQTGQQKYFISSYECILENEQQFEMFQEKVQNVCLRKEKKLEALTKTEQTFEKKKSMDLIDINVAQDKRNYAESSSSHRRRRPPAPTLPM